MMWKCESIVSRRAKDISFQENTLAAQRQFRKEILNPHVVVDCGAWRGNLLSPQMSKKLHFCAPRNRASGLLYIEGLSPRGATGGTGGCVCVAGPAPA